MTNEAHTTSSGLDTTSSEDSPQLTPAKGKRFRKSRPRPSDIASPEILKYNELQAQRFEAINAMFQKREEKRELAHYRKVEKPLEQVREERVKKWCTLIHVSYFIANGMHRIARSKLNKLFIPRILLRVHRRRMAAIRERLIRQYQFPSVDAHRLAKVPIFASWPVASLCSLAAAFKPQLYQKGTAVFHQGDIGDKMYYISFGHVSVVIKEGKKRDRESGKCVATLGEGAIFGEFALLVDEARTASIYCDEDVGVLYLEKATMMSIFDKLPRNIKSIMMDMTIQRRKDNMSKLYCLNAPDVQKVKLFEDWNYEQINMLIKCMVPCCFMKDEFIVHQGEFGDGMYFIGQGKCQVLFTKVPLPNIHSLEHWSGQVEDEMLTSTINQSFIHGSSKGAVLGRGACFGEIGCLFLEARQASVVALTSCDLWKIPKEVFISFLHKNPELFSNLKRQVNITRATRIDRSPAEYFTRSNLFDMLTKDIIEDLLARAKPRVYDYSLTIFQQGSPVEDLLVITSGHAKLYYRKDGKNSILGVFGPMSLWGEYEITTLKECHWSCQLRAESRVDAWYIAKHDFKQVVSRYGDDFEKFLEESLRKTRPVEQGVHFPGIQPKWNTAEYTAMCDARRKVLERYSFRKGIPIRDILPPVPRTNSVARSASLWSRPSSSRSARPGTSESHDSRPSTVMSTRSKVTGKLEYPKEVHFAKSPSVNATATVKKKKKLSSLNTDISRVEPSDVALGEDEGPREAAPGPTIANLEDEPLVYLKSLISACTLGKHDDRAEGVLNTCSKALSLPILQVNLLKASCGLPIKAMGMRNARTAFAMSV